jgi:hypothetical protein
VHAPPVAHLTVMSLTAPEWPWKMRTRRPLGPAAMSHSFTCGAQGQRGAESVAESPARAHCSVCLVDGRRPACVRTLQSSEADSSASSDLRNSRRRMGPPWPSADRENGGSGAVSVMGRTSSRRETVPQRFYKVVALVRRRAQTHATATHRGCRAAA